MLKNLDPLLTADLLAVLRSMGHGDTIAIVDRNFPAASTGRRVVDLSGATLDAATRAVMSVLPVDTFVEPAVFRMGVVDDPAAELPVHKEFQQIVSAAENRDVAVAVIDRFDFYARARDAFAVVYTTDDRPYGCFVLTKGVV